MGAAFESEIRAARTWLLDARRQGDAAEPRLSRWGWMQDVDPSPLNTAEVLVALAGDARLDAAVFGDACSYVMEGLQGAGGPRTVRHAAWIAIALASFCESCPAQALQPSVVACLSTAKAWLVERQNEDGGWGHLPGQSSVVSTTALVLRALGSSFRANADRAVTWLLHAQNDDGGWGLTVADEGAFKQAAERLSDSDAHELVRARIESNAACTAYAMLALDAAGRRGGEEGHAIRRGASWLLQHREPRTAGNPSSGGWPIFRERGIRAGASDTFRHFSTAWAIQALLVAGEDLRDAHLLEAVDYLRSLQQPAVVDRDGVQFEGGGWRCSQDGEPFVWATSNAILTLRAVARGMGELGGDEVVDILLRERRSQTASFIGRAERPWVTNRRTATLVASVTTLLAVLCMAAVATSPPGKAVGFVAFVAAAFLAAAPWAVVVAVSRDPTAPDLDRSVRQIFGVLAVVLGILGAAYFG